MQVYTETSENRVAVQTNLPGFNLLDKKVSIFQHPNKVAVVTSMLLTGTPWDRSDPHDWKPLAGKRYYRWRTMESYGFIRTKAGFPMPYHSSRGPRADNYWRNRFPQKALADLEEESEGGEAYRNAMWETFGTRSVQDIYPMMNTYGLINYPSIPINLRRGFRESDAETYAGIIFGKNRNSKRLQDAVLNTDAYVVSLAHQFRGLVSDDSLLSFMENTRFDAEMESTFAVHNPLMRKALKTLSPNSPQEILSRGLDAADLKRIEQLSLYVSHPLKKHQVSGIFKNLTFISWSDMYVHMYGTDIKTEKSMINAVIDSDWDEDLDEEEE